MLFSRQLPVSLARKILGNTFWQVFGRLGTAVIAFLTVNFLTNYWGAGNLALGQAKYGIYTYIYDFLATFGALADLGIFTIAVREMSQRPGEERQSIFSATITLRLITLVLGLLCAVAIVWLLPQYAGTEIPRGVAIVALGTGLFILSGTLSTILLLHLQMRFHAFALVLGKILTFGLILAVLFQWAPEPTTESFYALLWAGVAGSALTLVMTWWGARRFLTVRPSWNPVLMKQLFWTALPFGIATFINTIYFRLDITMMGLLLPPSAADGTCLAKFCGDQQNGIYGVAVRIMEVMMILPLYFMNSILPTLTKSIATGDQREVERHLRLPFLFLLILALPITIGLFLLAHPIVGLVTPEGFGSEVALRILTLPLIFIFFTTFFSFVLIAYGRQKSILWVNCGALLLNLVINIWALPRYGFVGASYATFVCEGMILLALLYFFRRVGRFPVPWKEALGTIFSAAIMGFCTWWLWGEWGAGVGKKSLAVIIPVAALIYGILLIVTRVIDRSFWKLLKRDVHPEPIPTDDLGATK